MIGVQELTVCWKMHLQLTVHIYKTLSCGSVLWSYLGSVMLDCHCSLLPNKVRRKHAAVCLRYCELHFRSVVPNGGRWWALCVSAYAYLLAAPRFLLYFPVEQNGLESLRLPIFSPAFLPVTRKVWESIPIHFLQQKKGFSLTVAWPFFCRCVCK